MAFTSGYRLLVSIALWVAIAAQTDETQTSSSTASPINSNNNNNSSADGKLQDLRKLLESARNWSRTDVQGVSAGVNRVLQFAHPPKFLVIDEQNKTMPILIFSSPRNSANDRGEQSVPITAFVENMNKLDDSMRRLLIVAKRIYAVSTDNVVVNIYDYQSKLLFNPEDFNRSIQALVHGSIANCSARQISVENCRINLPAAAEYPLAVLQVFMTPRRIGRSDIRFHLRYENGTTMPSANDTGVTQVNVIVVRPDGLVDQIFRICMTVFIIIITFGMGCDLDLKVIWVILKKPLAPLIGIFSQFCLMPLISFGIGMLFLNTPDTRLFGFGLLVVGCSPGGGSSNMWTLMLGGHLDLSMTMTFFSSMFALGMMPLWLFILAPFYVDRSQVVIPYMDIVKNLLTFTLPAAFGIGLRSWKPELAKKAENPVKIASLLYLIFMLTVGNWVNWWMYRTISFFPFLIPIAMVLPWCGMVFGYLLAFILRQGHRRALTISIETGIQNVGVAMIILRYAFPAPDGQLASVVVMIVILFTPIPLYLALLFRGLYRFCKLRREKKLGSESSSEEGVRLEDMDRDKATTVKSNNNKRRSDMQPLNN